MSPKTVSVRLNNGLNLTVLIDADDVELVSRYSWYAVSSKNTKYAKTGRNIRMHRLILGVNDPYLVVDHINGDGLDNRKSNLRIVDSTTNVQNRQRSKVGNRCPGVYKERGRWRAQVTVNYKKHHLGIFDCESDAILVVNEFRLQFGRPKVVV
jgi:hypothetical protein